MWPKITQNTVDRAPLKKASVSLATLVRSITSGTERFDVGGMVTSIV